MTLKANEVPSNGTRQEPIEPGSYPARLVQVIDLGLQPQEYLGEEKAPKIEITTTYELSDEFMKDEEGNDIEDKPRWVSETFPLNPQPAIMPSTPKLSTGGIGRSSYPHPLPSR